MNRSAESSLLPRTLSLAALTNGSMIVFALGLFPSLATVDPHFDAYGCLLIVLWGFAYQMSRGRCFELPGLMLVFAVEKGAYVARWCHWFLQDARPPLSEIYEASPIGAIFFSIYGLVDLSFMLCFSLIAFHGWRQRQERSA